MTDTAHNRPMVLAIGIRFALKRLVRLRFATDSTSLAEFDAAKEQIESAIEQLKDMATEVPSPPAPRGADNVNTNSQRLAGRRAR